MNETANDVTEKAHYALRMVNLRAELLHAMSDEGKGESLQVAAL